MLNIGWTELVVIGIVALIVVGPKDLPKMFRALGQFTGKARAMAREFQRAMDDAANESGMKDVARDLREATSGKSMGLDGVTDAVRDLRDLKKWDPSKPAAKKPAKAAVPDPAAPEAPETTAGVKPRGPATAKLAEDQAARTQAMRAAAETRRARAEAPVADPAAPPPPDAPAASGKPGA